MYKRYFRKKDPNCRKEEIEWVEMTGREFYRFVTFPEGNGIRVQARQRRCPGRRRRTGPRDGELDTELLRQITAAILVHPSGVILLELKNGQVIEGSESP